MIKEEFKAIPRGDSDIRKFGILFFLIGAGLAVFLYYKESNLWQWFAIAAGLFLVGGLFIKPLLRPLYMAWMYFAVVLGFVMTRVILGILFFGVFTPMGMLMKLFRVRMLELKLEPSATSYWEKREPVKYSQELTERMF